MQLLLSITINKQGGLNLRMSCFILGHTLVRAPVRILNLFNVQGTRATVHLSDCHKVISLMDQFVIEVPPNVNWQVTLCDHTRCANHLPGIRGSVSESKWHDLRWNWEWWWWWELDQRIKIPC